MKKYKVYMTPPPLWCVVKAKNKEEAIDKAINEDKWNDQIDYGGEDYTVKEIK